MKSILFSVLFLLVPKLAVSQVSKTNELIVDLGDKLVYLDSTNSETTSKNYAYVRLIKDSKLKKESYVVQEYYRSGVLRMQGISKNSSGNSYEGEVTNYYDNGTKKAISYYTKNLLNGKEIQWYENGKIKQEGEYIIDEKKKESEYKVIAFWDANGEQKVIDGNGDYEEIREKFFASGKVKDGYKEGVWNGYNKIIGYTFRETYENKKLISGRSWDKNNTFAIYTEIMVKPMPRNGMMDFYTYVAKTYKLPNMPQGTKGKIYVTFVVDKDGKIVEPRIIKDLGYGAGQEALRILPNYSGFSPAEERGQKVRCSFSLPISIQNAN